VTRRDDIASEGNTMRIHVLQEELSVCKVREVPEQILSSVPCFVGRTATELSLVCATELVPVDALEREDGWRAMGIVGQLDFGLTGILARIAGVLAQANIPIFAVSTYDTDYVLVKQERLDAAVAALSAAGYAME